MPESLEIKVLRHAFYQQTPHMFTLLFCASSCLPASWNTSWKRPMKIVVIVFVGHFVTYIGMGSLHRLLYYLLKTTP